MNTYDLNGKQLAVLRWVADGCPQGRWDGYAHRQSARALHARGLLKIRGRGKTWTVEITARGRAQLEPHVAPRLETVEILPSSRQSNVSAGGIPAERAAAIEPNATPSRSAIKVPSSLRRIHPLVAATREAANGVKVGSDGRLLIGNKAGIIYVATSRNRLGDALRIAQAIAIEAERRGWRVVPFERRSYSYDEHDGTALVVRSHAYPFEIHEATRTLPFTDAEISAWLARPRWDTRERLQPPSQLKRKEPTGQLKLVMPNGYGGGRATWSEGRLGTMGERLADAFETLVLRADADDLAAAEAAVRREEHQRLLEQKQARARTARIEAARVDRLLNGVSRWSQAREVRGYVAALREGLPRLSAEDQQRIAEWCDWSLEWADRTDPTLAPGRIRGLDDERDSQPGAYQSSR